MPKTVRTVTLDSINESQAYLMRVEQQLDALRLSIGGAKEHLGQAAHVLANAERKSA